MYIKRCISKGGNQKVYIKGQTIQGPKEGQKMTYKRLHGKLNIEQP